MCEEIRSAEDDVVSEWKEIVSNDDDVASGELLSWSGLSDIWDRHELWGEFDFLRDVAEFCSHIDIGREDWDADFPGHSGTWQIIKTNDEDELKKEMSKKLTRLIWNNRKKIKLFIKKQEERQSQKLAKLRKGPESSIYIGTVAIWDDIFPTEYEYYFEDLPEYKYPHLKLWEKVRDTWKEFIDWGSYDGDLKQEAVRFMNRYQAGEDGVAHIEYGPLFDKKEKE